MSAYATIAEGQTYMDGVVHSDGWDLATNAERTTALLNATRIIDRLNILGKKNDATQELQFPRYDDTEIPDDIKFACAAIAGALLDGVEPDLEFENLRLLQAGMNGAKSTYASDIVQTHVSAGLGSSTAWAYLASYVIDPRTMEVYKA